MLSVFSTLGDFHALCAGFLDRSSEVPNCIGKRIMLALYREFRHFIWVLNSILGIRYLKLRLCGI